MVLKVNVNQQLQSRKQRGRMAEGQCIWVRKKAVALWPGYVGYARSSGHAGRKGGGLLGSMEQAQGRWSEQLPMSEQV